jgi:hypothetical protein
MFAAARWATSYPPGGIGGQDADDEKRTTREGAGSFVGSVAGRAWPRTILASVESKRITSRDERMETPHFEPGTI